ncbi:hypothetical protein L1887_52158 [Cichorium endivia]|nr:hypothetical protein L1887_52158 [Cichorium endivia]
MIGTIPAKQRRRCVESSWIALSSKEREVTGWYGGGRGGRCAASLLAARAVLLHFRDWTRHLDLRTPRSHCSQDGEGFGFVLITQAGGSGKQGASQWQDAQMSGRVALAQLHMLG